MKLGLKSKISIAVILTISIIAVVFVVSVANFEFSTINYEKNKAENAILKNVQLKLDSIIDTNMKFANIMALSDEAQNFVDDEYIDYFDVYKLSRMIKSYSSFSESHIFAFCENKDIYIDGKGTYHSYDLKKELGAVPYDMESLKTQKGGIYSANLIDGVHGNNVVLICKSSTKRGGELYFIIVINNKELNRIFSADGGKLYLVEDDKVIYGDENITYEDLSGKGSPELLSGMIYNWKFVYDVDAKPELWIYVMYLFILAVLCVAAVFIGLKLSDRIYKPIGNIVKRFSDEDNIDNEIEYIDRKLTEIYENNLKLERGMTSYKKHFEKQYLRNVLYGTSVCGDMNYYSSKNDGSKYMLAVIECRNGEITDEICEYIESFISCETVNMSNSIIAVIINGEDSDYEKQFRLILISIEQKFGKCCFGAILEKAVEDIADLSKLYPYVDRALRNRALSENGIMTVSKIADDDNYYYPVDIEKAIIDYIKNGDFDNALAAVDSVLEKNLVEMKLSHDILTDFKLAMVSTIKRTMNLLDKNEAALFGDDYIMYIELGASYTVDGMREKVLGIFKTIFESCEDHNDNAGNFLAEKLLKYINEHYDNPDMVCLTSISEHFNVSPGYISRVFKKYSGVNYKEYITSYRMEQAKKLLIENDGMKVKDVSEAVGYSNVNSFIRMFEKREGFSPDVYRKRKR